jgi:hypothetical protein
MSEEKRFIGTKVDEKTWLDLKRYALERGMRLNETLSLAVNELINKHFVNTKTTKKGDKK